MRNVGKIVGLGATAIVYVATAQMANAQAADVSPVLLIETAPSDMAGYDRMVFVKYIDDSGVSAAYKAYNRSEFIRIEDSTPTDIVSACRNGRATSLDDIKAFEASQSRAGRTAIVARFCIRGIANWEAGNKKVWLDPIFDGMPHAARFKNK